MPTNYTSRMLMNVVIQANSGTLERRTSDSAAMKMEETGANGGLTEERTTICANRLYSRMRL